ncbi:MAG: hypothetical protein M1839_000533 [Geoglossum umbratile]|nr:MAG: hypothetical protein M1839_000533 [Geoglossum umbratile]
MKLWCRYQGLHKLQLIAEAKKICPDVVIVLGEDLTRFRDVSKDLYNFLQEFIWSKRVERLGFDEVFMDVTDMIDYNVKLLDLNNPSNEYFHLSRADPTIGFSYDATQMPGHTYPATTSELPSPTIPVPESPESSQDGLLRTRLVLASHLARYLRHQLETQKGYTCTSGVSTSKLLAKLVGATNKPNAQTTLLPPYESFTEARENNVTAFLGAHEVGRIPGIGFKLAQKIRNHVLGQPTISNMGLGYGETNERVLVRDVRCLPSIGPDTLEKVLGGPGVPQGIGGKIWGLLNGVDDTEVVLARKAPKQISIEDSYLRLDTLEEVNRELKMLAESLIRRMHADLLEEDDDPNNSGGNTINPPASSTLPTETVIDSPAHQPTKKRWIAHPRTLRLTTRPRQLPATDNARRSMTRISRSCPMPPFILSLTHPPTHLATKLATETLLPLFRKLHPEKSGWDLSLINVAAVNMAEGGGRDIGRMFREQEEGLKGWKVEDRDVPPSPPSALQGIGGVTQPPTADQCHGSEDRMPPTQESNEDTEGLDAWGNNDNDDGLIFQNSEQCNTCGARMPDFAMPAHERFHQM